MKEIFIFALGASVSGAIFLVALLELIFTVRRRKIREGLEIKLQELKAAYNQSVNQMVLDEEGKLAAAEKEIEEAHTIVETEKETITKEYEEQIKELEKHSSTALLKAKEKAKRLEEEAKMKAENYLETRKTEVEQELMNLVMNVTKKVLPESLSYDLQKELVIRALEDAKTENSITNE